MILQPQGTNNTHNIHEIVDLPLPINESYPAAGGNYNSGLEGMKSYCYYPEIHSEMLFGGSRNYTALKNKERLEFLQHTRLLVKFDQKKRVQKRLGCEPTKTIHVGTLIFRTTQAQENNKLPCNV